MFKCSTRSMASNERQTLRVRGIFDQMRRAAVADWRAASDHRILTRGRPMPLARLRTIAPSREQKAGRGLALAMANSGAHAALLAAHLASPFSRFLCSHAFLR